MIGSLFAQRDSNFRKQWFLQNSFAKTIGGDIASVWISIFTLNFPSGGEVASVWISIFTLNFPSGGNLWTVIVTLITSDT